MDEGAPPAQSDLRPDPFHRVTLWLLTLGGGLLAALLIRLRLGVDPDLWLHLRLGEQLRAGERFQRLPDPLVVLADQPYSPTQWLAEVAMSVVHEVSGVAGIHVLRALAVVALLIFLQLTAVVYTTPVRAAGVALPALVASAAQWGERPQLAGLVLLATTTWLWSRARRDATVPWLVIPLTWVWAMLHGSWVLGVATGTLFVLAMFLEHPRRERAWARLVGVVAASVAVAGLTPLGPSLLLEPLAVGAAARGRVNEWAAPGLTNPLVIVVVLMALTVLLRSVRHLRASLPELLIAASGVALAVTAVRTIAFGAVLVVPALAAAFAREEQPGATRERLSPWPLVVTGALLLLIPGVVLAAPSSGPLPRSVDTAVAQLPAGAVVAVEPAASGWVLWEHPEVRPLRDLRAEVYSAPVADAYESFFRAEPGWQSYAAAHDVAALVVETDSRLDRAVRADGAWVQAARAGDHAVWVPQG
jgi:hypothetical protein